MRPCLFYETGDAYAGIKNSNSSALTINNLENKIKVIIFFILDLLFGVDAELTGIVADCLQ